MARSKNLETGDPLPQAGQLVPTPPGMPAPVLDPRARHVPYWCGWDASTRLGKAMVLNAINGDGVKARDVLGEPVSVVNAFICQLLRVDEDTGEETLSWKMVLVDNTGRMVTTWSGRAMDFLAAALIQYGDCPWNPPIPVLITEYKTDKGRHAYRFTICTE
jgi:hypothetical protein